MAVNSRSRTVFYTTLRSLLAAPLPPSSPVSFGLKSARARPEGGPFDGRAVARPPHRGAIPRPYAFAGALLALLGLSGDLQEEALAAGSGFSQDQVLDFLGLRFEGEEGDAEGGEAEDLVDSETVDFVEEAADLSVVGTPPLVMGGWAQWNRIYYLPKGQGAGLVMLLVERVGKAADQTWTCVDPSLRVQIVCLKDKQCVFTKPPKGIGQWTPFPGLTSKTRDMVLAASSRLIARRELDADYNKVKSANKSKGFWKTGGKKKSSKKTSLANWVWVMGSNMFCYGWLYRSWGGVAGVGFAAWRIWRYFQLGPLFVRMYEAGVAAKETAEEVSDYWSFVVDAWESGELETILMGLAGVVFVIWAVSCGYRQWQGLSDSDSESDMSDGDVIVGTTVPDSDDEPDAKGLYAELQRGQDELRAGLLAIKEAMGQDRTRPPPRASSGAGGQDDEGETPTASQLDQFIAKLNEHEDLVKSDSDKGTRGSGRDAGRSSSESDWERLPSSPGSVSDTIAQLEMESKNPKEALLKTLRSYEHVPHMKVGGIKSRVAPTVLSKVYKGGRCAKLEVQEWLRTKELTRAPIANEMLVLAMTLDRMMISGDFKGLINSQASELSCLRMYAIMKAYEGVSCESDWKRPRNANGAKWKSKVDWSLGEEYLRLSTQDTIEDPSADDEVTDKLRKKAQIQKHLTSVRDAAPKDDE